MKFALFGAAVLQACLAAALVACSSGSSDDSDDDGGSPTVASAATAQESPTAAASRPGATPTKAGPPTFTPGKWTEGEAVATVSGGVALTVTGKLNNQASTERNTTRLIYVAGTDTISISISTEFQPFVMSVCKQPTSVRSSPTQACEATYTERTDKRVAGSFRCANSRIEGGQGGEAVIEGTFSASR